MKSPNFERLRVKRSLLADLAGFAERYAHNVVQHRLHTDVAKDLSELERMP